MIPVIFLAELRNLISYFKPPLEPAEETTEDYTIIVPAWGDCSVSLPREYWNKTFFLTILNGNNSPKLRKYLAKAERNGAQLFGVNHNITARDDAKFFALKESLNEIKTKYTVIMDADSYFKGDIGRVCKAMEERKIDLVTVKILVDNHSNLLERLQQFEYQIGMRTRHYAPHFTSACFIARTEALKEILDRHSLYPYGGDVEIGLIAKNLGMEIRHTSFKVYTTVPTSLKELVKQRIRWWAGCFRRVIINPEKSISLEILMFLYPFIFVYLLLPFRYGWLFSLLHLHPHFIVLAWLIHIPLSMLSARSRSPIAVIYPLYAFFKVTLLCLPVFGILKWFWHWKKTGETGRFRWTSTAPPCKSVKDLEC